MKKTRLFVLLLLLSASSLNAQNAPKPVANITLDMRGSGDIAQY